MALPPRPKGKLGVDFAYKRDATGTIIGYQAPGGGGSVGGGGGKLSPLQQFASVISGFSKPGSLDKDTQKALAKLDVGSIGYKDLAKFGLDDNLSKPQFKEFKGLLKDAQDNKSVNKKETRQLAKFGQDTALDNSLADIRKDVDKLVPDGTDLLAPQRGMLAGLDMSIFARRAVDRAKGVRGAIGTSVRGDAGYGKSLARISLGAV